MVKRGLCQTDSACIEPVQRARMEKESQFLFHFVIERISFKNERGKALHSEIIEMVQEESLRIDSGIQLINFLCKHVQFESMEHSQCGRLPGNYRVM